MKNFVDCAWLNKHLEDDNVFIIDCRFDLFDPAYGKAAYARGHIKGAYYFDLNEDFAGEMKTHGGARPVPELSVLGKKLEAIGVNTDSTIICYDDKTYSSARAWWQFQYMGLAKVYILNGGYAAWTKLGLPVSSEPPQSRSGGRIEIKVDEDIYSDIDYVKKAQANDAVILVDSREQRRFSGEYEPLYPKAGHIPGAINLHWQKAVNEDGTIKDGEALKNTFSFAQDAEEIITYCGSGIDGAVNFVILDELGFRARLYVGSVSDWISYQENTLETD